MNILTFVRQLPMAMAIVVALAGVTLAGPAIRIDNTTFDFGKTLQHVKVTHDFVIESVGDEPLRIRRVVPGCGCTEAPLKDSVLAPGESTVLSITFSTKSYAGKITKRPYMMTNTPAERVMLNIKADVMIDDSLLAPLNISPFEIEISNSTGPDRRQAAFLLENRGNREVTITLIDHDAATLEVELPGKVRAGQAATGWVRILPDVTVDELEKSITFELDDDSRSRYTLPVSMTSASEK
ncbi:MAG: DUF1573 domain-containing protein, partial [Candidatus Zixiibacteriota bacterium]